VSTTSKRSVQVFCILLLCFSALSLRPVRHAFASTTYVGLTSYRVSGVPNYYFPGDEAFWTGIPWTNVSLAASLAPGGGHTQNVSVRSANDGSRIFTLFRWNDPQGPSFGSSSELYNVTTGPNGKLAPLNFSETATVKQLFYNSTYYYPDRLAMLWYIGSSSQRQPTPAMILGTMGAWNGGSAEIWHWQSNPTDNNALDSSYPGGYVDSSGNVLIPPNRMSFAEDDFTNSSGFFVIPSNFPNSTSPLAKPIPNLVPSSDPFLVHVGTNFSNTNKTWTVEMVRTLTTPDATQYRAQLSTGSNYYTAFAIWNGKVGESSHLKSVSNWYNVTISNQSISSPSATPA